MSWHNREGCWRAQIKVGGRNHWLGSFADEEDAARAYDLAAEEAFGEYAWLNFPPVRPGG